MLPVWVRGVVAFVPIGSYEPNANEEMPNAHTCEMLAETARLPIDVVACDTTGVKQSKTAATLATARFA